MDPFVDLYIVAFNLAAPLSLAQLFQRPAFLCFVGVGGFEDSEPMSSASKVFHSHQTCTMDRNGALVSNCWLILKKWALHTLGSGSPKGLPPALELRAHARLQILQLWTRQKAAEERPDFQECHGVMENVFRLVVAHYRIVLRCSEFKI